MLSFVVCDGPKVATDRPVAGEIEPDYLKGIALCWEVHPTLGTEPQNILTEGIYEVIFPVGAAVRANT